MNGRTVAYARLRFRARRAAASAPSLIAFPHLGTITYIAWLWRFLRIPTIPSPPPSPPPRHPTCLLYHCARCAGVARWRAARWRGVLRQRAKRGARRARALLRACPTKQARGAQARFVRFTHAPRPLPCHSTAAYHLCHTSSFYTPTARATLLPAYAFGALRCALLSGGNIPRRLSSTTASLPSARRHCRLGLLPHTHIRLRAAHFAGRAFPRAPFSARSIFRLSTRDTFLPIPRRLPCLARGRDARAHRAPLSLFGAEKLYLS